MPIYQCVAPEGAINHGLRGELARELTRIHCEITGAAPEFVQVVFLDLPAGAAFVNGGKSAMTNIVGYMRAGRPPEMREQLLQRINLAWSQLTSIPSAQLKITLFDVPANWIMQGGHMMPEIGHDEEWLDQTKAVRE